MPARKPSRIKRHDALLDGLYTGATLLPDEDGDAYDALQKSVVKSLQPRTTLERALTLEVAAKTWDIMRLQRYRMHLIQSGLADAVEDMLAPTVEPSMIPSLSDDTGIKRGWLKRNPAVLAAVKQQLKLQKLGADHLYARAYVRVLPTLERLDKQIEQLEQSRSRALKSIAALNELLSKRLAEEMKTIEGEYRREDGRAGSAITHEAS